MKFWPTVVITAITLMVTSVMLPHNGWDLLGHLGSALQYTIDGKQQLLDETYRLASETLDQSKMLELQSGTPERVIWGSNPESFSQLLPFYQPRVLVTLPANAFYQLGFNPIKYLQWQSSVCAALGVVLFSALISTRTIAGFFLVFPLIILITGGLDVARFEGADALSYLIFSIACIGLLRDSKWGFWAIAFIPLARSDMVILSVMILLTWIVVFPHNRKLSFAAMIASVIIYFTINTIFGNYGWVTQFYVAQIEYLAFPADIAPSFSFTQYVHAVLRGVAKLPYNFQFQFFMLVFTFILFNCIQYLKVKQYKKIFNNKLILLALVSGFFVFVHFMIFPSMHARYFAGQYLLVTLTALQLLSTEYARTNSSRSFRS